MIPSLSPVTIGGAPEKLADYLALAERCGFGGVELSMDTVIRAAEESSWDAVKAMFVQLAVAPASAGLPVDCYGDDAKFNEGMAILPATAKAAQTIGCTRVCTWIPPAINDDPTAYRRRTVERFRKVAEVLGDYGIRFGIEFVGPKTLRVGPKAMGKHEFVYNIPQTLDLIADIDARAGNVGMLVDSFHWFCTGSNYEELAALSPKQIVYVHINDAPKVPIDQQMDMERLLPGEGIIDLNAFIKALTTVGYTEFVAVETFSADLKAMGRDAACEKAGAAMERFFS
jgi:sugar phosphate isomerase/epimerase